MPTSQLLGCIPLDGLMSALKKTAAKHVWQINVVWQIDDVSIEPICGW
jgi:hypothetical protein